MKNFRNSITESSVKSVPHRESAKNSRKIPKSNLFINIPNANREYCLHNWFRMGMLYLKCCPGDEKQPRPGGQGTDDLGNLHPGRCETFGGDGSGHDGHHAEIHDTDDQKNDN
jgi:hypothetical protein